ncbi:GNAT family N-acetyltransferase [Rhizobium sp. PP-CC-3G-465]|uniref:GNAT family N-acetyltransferase n=1 Tax=Rhizobium sp. PP-CC-3G-465 TaxID=2135648 RepID=UPI00105315A0
MTISFVTTAERPDLAHTTGTWRWEAFFSDGETSLAEMLELDAQCASSHDLMPTVLVMLEEQQPVGMVALCLGDLEGRPELNPWLAGLYVDPMHRGRGHSISLINQLEALARKAGIERLSLYSAGAVGLYSKAGWTTVETFERGDKTFSIMQKQLSPEN